MPQKKKKHNVNSNTAQKSLHEKFEVNRIAATCSYKISKNLTSYFKNEEIQELKGILKRTNLNKTPIIVLAAILEKTNLLDELIKEGRDIHEVDENNINALVWSIKTKKMQSINTLLTHGAEPYIKTDHNTDHILTMALETKIWDEQSLISLWKNIQCISRIDVNLINKNGHTMLHMAVRREWVQFIEILMSENVQVDITNSIGITPLMLACYRNNINIVDILLKNQADVRKEDCKGFTALCYALSAAMSKNLKPPYMIIETLLEKHKELKYDIKEYIMSKIVQHTQLNSKIIPPFEMSTHVMSFIIHKMSDGLKICVELNIIRQLQEAFLNNIEDTDRMKYNLMVMNELFKTIDDMTETTNEILSCFLNEGCADVCVAISKKYENHELFEWISIVCLQFIIACCIKINYFEGWLEHNYMKFLAAYIKYRENHLIELVSLKDMKEYIFKINEEKLMQFQEIISLLENGERLHGIQETALEEESSTVNLDDTICNAKSQEVKSSSKKTKRRTKALKAKIAKIKSADLTERLNTTGKRVIETTVKAQPCNISIPQGEPFNDAQNTHNIEFEFLLKTEPNNQSEIVDAIKKSILTDFDPKKENMENYFSEQEQKRSSDWKMKIQQLPFNYKCYPHFKLLNLRPETEPGYSNYYSLDKESEERLNQILKYLCELLQRIIDRYRKHWAIDRELESELYLGKDKEEKSEYVVHILRNLEQEKIQLLESEFARVINHIRILSIKSPEECNTILKKLEVKLLTHQIRGENIMDEVVPQNEILVEVKYDDSFTNKDNFALPKYMEDVLNNKTKMLDEVNIDIADSSNINTGGESSELHYDELYVKEMHCLPKSEPLDIQKQFQSKHKTLKSSYHLVSSIMSVVDSDNENSEVPSENDKCERIYTKSRTFFNKSAKFLERHGQNQLDDYSSKFLNHLRHCDPQNGCSRWSYLLHSLETNKDCQQFLGGTVRISPQNKRHTHVISTGGNFTPVELGLDNYNRPLAVKRIPSGSCVCKMIKQLVTPLLTLRNTNILHYCACDFDNNELIIATPLCEYNMGQYVMLMKQNNKLTLTSNDIVRQFLTGIMFLHSQTEAIIHGNLKPSNIFIDSNDVVRVAEFGTHKALFKLKEAPNSSIIWFSTETFKTFKQHSKMECTCASDIQVAGMLIHFIITAGKHVYGDDTREILKNLEKAVPKFSSSDLELQDLLTWMLMFFPNERPTVQQVFSHVYFWSTDKKWQFILACAGLSSRGADIPINLSDFYYTMDKTAFKDNIKGKWTQVVRNKFPNPTTKIEENDDTPSGLLRYIRACVKSVPSEEFRTESECCNFFINSFPAFTLSLYRIIDNTEWMEHPAFINFYTVHRQTF